MSRPGNNRDDLCQVCFQSLDFLGIALSVLDVNLLRIFILCKDSFRALDHPKFLCLTRQFGRRLLDQLAKVHALFDLNSRATPEIVVRLIRLSRIYFALDRFIVKYANERRSEVIAWTLLQTSITATI